MGILFYYISRCHNTPPKVVKLKGVKYLMKIKKTLKNYQNKSVIPAIMIERAYIFSVYQGAKKTRSAWDTSI